MGEIQFAGCHDARGQLTIWEMECPKCHEEGGLEVFTKDNRSVGDSICAACGYRLPENTEIEQRRG